MEKLTIEVPAMYADHHAVEVRRILLEMPGIEDVYASSAFHTVELSYDPAKVKADDIKASLDNAGYLKELPVPVESGIASIEDRDGAYFRHTSTYEQTRQTVSFTQIVPYMGRPLWTCPGMGVVTVSKMMQEEE